MAKFEAEKLVFTAVDGRDYKVEFDRDSLEKCSGMNPFGDDKTPIETTSIILWGGLMKHHNFITLKRAREIVEGFLDEGYGIDAFTDIIDEYGRCYTATFTASAEKKGAKIFSRTTE